MRCDAESRDPTCEKSVRPDMLGPERLNVLVFLEENLDCRVVYHEVLVAV